MINIISPNASIDRFYKYTGQDSEKNKYYQFCFEKAGGKGINLARTLKHLDTKSKVFTLIGGYNGYKLASLCKKEQIKIRYQRINSETRLHLINLESAKDLNNWKEIPQPVFQKEIIAFTDFLKKYNFKGKKFIISGSLNPGLPTSFYTDVIHIISSKNPKASITLDVSGAYLKNITENLTSPIELIKINKYEWEDWTGLKYSKENFYKHCQIMHKKNIAMIIMTNQEKDVLLSTPETQLSVSPLKIATKKQTIGAGDAFLAGYLWGLKQHKPLAIRLDIANKVAQNFLTGENILLKQLQGEVLVNG